MDDLKTLQYYQRLFNFLDVKRTGKVSYVDVHHLVQLLNPGADAEGMRIRFLAVNSSEEGFLDFDGFRQFIEQGGLEERASQLANQIPPPRSTRSGNTINSAELIKSVGDIIASQPWKSRGDGTEKIIKVEEGGISPNALDPADPVKLKRNKDYFSANQQALATQYPKEFIAINNGRVVAHGIDWIRVLNCAEQHSYVVFPSQPGYTPEVDILWTEIFNNPSSDSVKITAMFKVEHKSVVINDAVVDTGAVRTCVPRSWVGEELWAKADEVKLSAGRTGRLVNGIVNMFHRVEETYNVTFVVLDQAKVFLIGRDLLKYYQMFIIGENARPPYPSGLAPGKVAFIHQD